MTSGESWTHQKPNGEKRMPTSDERHQVDIAWFRHHLLDEILPAWRAAITVEGLFACHFDHDWTPQAKGFGTLVSQTRLLYNFAQGYALTGEPVYRDAVESGSRFLMDHFWDAKFGGWVRACAPTGEIVDDVKDCYGHAFVLFGLAHASATTGSPRCREALLETWTVMTDRFRDGQGGYRYFMSRDFRDVDPQRSQNPLMHLFEALLAVGDLPGMGELHGEAVTLADFVLNRLRRPEDLVLPEVYDADWNPLPAAQEGRIDVGHAFEWAFLMSDASARGLSDTYAAEAARFLAYGMQLGYDREKGGIFSPVAPDGSLLHRRKGWWEQCETIRALLRFVDRHARPDLMEPLHQTVMYVRDQFVDARHGGWHSFRELGTSPAGQAKGHETKLDYHVVGMCMEAIRVAEAAQED